MVYILFLLCKCGHIHGAAKNVGLNTPILTMALKDCPHLHFLFIIKELGEVNLICNDKIAEISIAAVHRHTFK
jgi:hypothetical protein